MRWCAICGGMISALSGTCFKDHKREMEDLKRERDEAIRERDAARRERDLAAEHDRETMARRSEDLVAMVEVQAFISLVCAQPDVMEMLKARGIEAPKEVS